MTHAKIHRLFWYGVALALLLFGLLGRATAINQPKPSEALAVFADPQSYLIARSQYTLSYNRDRGIPNWVSWQLNQSWLGTTPRSPFKSDASLPASWYRVSPDDYTNSGFDRGHVLPAADRNRTPEDSQSVSLMTNILPQAPDSNRGPWEQLESYCRSLARQGKELYIIAGGAGTGGTGEKGDRSTIGRGRVAVPAWNWKVVVVFDRAGMSLSDMTTQTRVIAVKMPNQQGIKGRDWREFLTTIDEIEKLTGLSLPLLRPGDRPQ